MLYLFVPQALATLPSEQWIHSMVATGNSVWVNAGDTPILHVYHAPSASLLATVDCTRTVVEVLRGACVCVCVYVCVSECV